MKVIETISLTTGYIAGKNRIEISEGISESLYPGELTCLLGRNGSGKSTLLKTLSGFLPPLAGTIEIMGKKLQDYSPRQLSQMIGVVLTERFSASNMTVYDLVATGRSPYTGYWGGLSAEDRKIIEESLQLAGITGMAQRKVVTLSDGERQKTFIAKALAQQTPVIFLDEPTAFLDYPGKVDTFRLLKKLARQQERTIFLSTHDLEVALRVTDRLWLMDREKGLTTGTPQQLAEEGRIGKYFDSEGLTFNKAEMNFSITV